MHRRRYGYMPRWPGNTPRTTTHDANRTRPKCKYGGVVLKKHFGLSVNYWMEGTRRYLRCSGKNAREPSNTLKYKPCNVQIKIVDKMDGAAQRCIHVCTHTHIYIYIYIQPYMYIHTNMDIYIYIYICINWHVYIYIYKERETHEKCERKKHIHINMHVYTHIYI